MPGPGDTRQDAASTVKLDCRGGVAGRSAFLYSRDSMRFEIYIALRYLRGKRKSRLLSLITFIAVTGVAVGVTALVVVMSVVSGFEQTFTQVITGNRAHISVEPVRAYISEPEAFIAQLESAAPEILASSPVSQAAALLRRPGHGEEAGAFVLGIDPAREQQVTCLGDNLIRSGKRPHAGGRMPRDNEIALGYQLAKKINAGIGDRLRVLGEQPEPVFLTVCGISQARMTEIDAHFGFVTLATAARLTGRSGADAVQCKIADPMAAARIAEEIEQATGVAAYPWSETYSEYFAMLAQHKSTLFTILVFIILVAAFNIASTLIMMVMEKRQDIGVLRTIGVSGPSVLFIFVMEGLLIGAVGTVAGVVAGSLIAINIDPIAQGIARMMGLGSFQSEYYYFDHLPAAVDVRDIAVIGLSAIALTFVSTIYPAWSASRLNPVDALRRE